MSEELYRVPGPRLRWAMAYAKENGIAVLRVQPDGQGGYIVTVAIPDQPEQQHGLAPVVDANPASRRLPAVAAVQGIGVGLLIVALGIGMLGPAFASVGIGVGVGVAGLSVGILAGAAILLPAIIIGVVVAVVLLPMAANGLCRAKEALRG